MFKFALSLLILLTSVTASSKPFLYPKAEPPPSPNSFWIGIMGDSSSTGAVSDKNLQPNIGSLLSLTLEFVKDRDVTDIQPSLDNHPLAGKIKQFDPPLRIFNSNDETQHEDNSRLRDAMKATLRLDVEENSFGYQYAMLKGLKASQVVFVAQDGSRVDSIPKQILRFYDMPAQTLPSIVFVSFTANDFCDENIFTDDLGQRVNAFAKDLKEAWQKAAPNLKPHPNGTEFVVLSPMEVANVLANPAILEQKVSFEGETKTCGEIRGINFQDQLDAAKDGLNFFTNFDRLANIAKLELQNKVQKEIVKMCPAVLKTRPGDQDRLHRLQQVQTEFREVWRRQINELNTTYDGKGLHWQFVEAIADVKFTTGDVSNDCFHPSAEGHAKLAEDLLKLDLKDN